MQPHLSPVPASSSVPAIENQEAQSLENSALDSDIFLSYPYINIW